MNKAYEFISYPYESLFGISPKVTTTLTIHDQDVGLDEMLLQFTNFLRSAGYTIDSDQYLSIVSDEELEDEEEDWWDKGLDYFTDDEEDEEDWSDYEAEEERLSWLSLPDIEKFGMKNDLDKDFDRKIDECWNPEVEEFGRKFEAIKHTINNLQDVTRVEVIDAEGRAYVNTNAAYVVTHLQDDGRTLKVFLK